MIPPPTIIPFLESYLPSDKKSQCRDLPFVTLTYAQSLDSRISKGPGIRTVISQPETKAMTHYLRSKHDAIMVGINTFLADDPALNCRCAEDGTKRHPITPVIIDPHFKIQSVYGRSKLQHNFLSSEGSAPIVVISGEYYKDNRDLLQKFRNKYSSVSIVPIDAESNNNRLKWSSILKELKKKCGIKSIMIEGGANVINDLLNARNGDEPLVNTVIITIGPVFLGNKGVEVSPNNGVEMTDVKWWTGIRDAVVAGRLICE